MPKCQKVESVRSGNYGVCLQQSWYSFHKNEYQNKKSMAE